MFESLLLTDENQRLSPGLATSYKPLDDTTWEFKLREGVTFHDGSPFTAKDVVFTVCRIPTVENSPSSFTVYTKGIAGMEVKDPHTLLIKTDTPFPLLPNEVAAWRSEEHTSELQSLMRISYAVFCLKKKKKSKQHKRKYKERKE